jgi:NitT/TauT family transport system permease protein
VAALEAVCRLGWVAPTILVPPSAMLRGLAQALMMPDIRRDFAATLVNVALASVIASVGGVVLGLVLHALPRLRRAVEPFIASYYALPLFALYPVLVVLLGIGGAPIVATGVLYAMMTVVIATANGLDRVRPVFLLTARVLRMSPLATAWRIQLPAAAPEILSGVALAVSYSFVGVIASEFLMAPAGIGHAIADAYGTFRTAQLYGLILALCVLVAAINFGLRRLRAAWPVR